MWNRSVLVVSGMIRTAHCVLVVYEFDVLRPLAATMIACASSGVVNVSALNRSSGRSSVQIGNSTAQS